MKVLPLVGFKSLKALNAFHTLLLGLKMLPAYVEMPYEKFYESFDEMSDAEKENCVRQAVLHVPLNEEEFQALAGFATDANGIGISKENIANFTPDQMYEMLVAVCLEIGKIKIEILTKAEKKKLPDSPSTSEPNT